MKILIVSATNFEIAPLLKNVKKIRSGKNLHTFFFEKHTIDVLFTGIGMTSTAFHLGKTLNKKYDLAINAGVSGSFKREIPLGAVVNVVSDCFSDIGAEDGNKFLTLKEMGLKEVSSLKPQISSPKIRKTLSDLPQVNGITVNTVHGNSASIKKVVQKFHPDIESMEGAAFFFSCNREKIPCLQIRAISNYVKKRNKKNWKLNLAVKNLCNSIEQILQNL
ncbi:MAG: futalosine hydrolase [Bacteroidetes bacterium]|nr:futalosine hydrolase [Bacteroidota bacterium]